MTSLASLAAFPADSYAVTDTFERPRGEPPIGLPVELDVDAADAAGGAARQNV